MFRQITSYFLLSITLLLCVIALMLSTPWGSHLTVNLINKTTPFSMSYQDGIIIENIKLSHFSLSEKNLSIDAKNIVFKFNPRCVFQQKLCVDELSIQSLFVNSKQQNEQRQRSEKSDSNSIEKLVFPFVIQASKLYLKNLMVMIDDITITAENIKTKALIAHSSIALFNPDIGSLSLNLSDSANLTDNTNLSNSTAPKNNANDNTLWPVASLPVIALPLDLLIEKAQVKTFRLQPINDLPQQQLNNSQFTLAWQATELTIKHFESEHAVYGSATLQGRANFIPPYNLNITVLSKLKNITGLPFITSLFDETQQSLQLSGDLSALTVNSQLTGTIALTAKGQVDLTKQELPFTSDITLSKYPELDRLLSASQPITASITAKGDITKQQIEINGLLSAYGYQDAELSLHATHQGTLQGDLQSTRQGTNVTINTFAFNDKHTQSKLSLQGKLNYSDDLSWDVKLSSTGFSLPTIQSQHTDISGRISGNIDFVGENNLQKWSLKLNKSAIQGMINNMPISAVGNVELNRIETVDIKENSQWQLKPSHLTVTVGDARLEMNGFTDQNWHVTGALAIPTLAQLITDSRGDIAATFSIEGSITQPNLQFNNHIRHLYWQDIASPDLLLQGNYQPLQSHKIDLSLTSNKVYWQNLALSSFTAKLQGDIEQQNIHVNWLGDLAANLSLTSTWLADAKQWQSKLIDSDISFKGKQWQPDKNVAINYHQTTNTLWIEQHCWQGKSIHLCSVNDITVADTGEIALLADIELKDIGDLFIPDDIKVSTKLHNNISLKWQPHQPIDWSVTTTLSQGNIKLLHTKNLSEQPLTIAWQKGDAAFNLNNNILTSHLLIKPQALVNQQAQEKAALVDIKTRIDFGNEQRLSGKIMVDDLSLFFLQAYLSEVNQINGSLNANVNISGSLSAPDFYGNMAINNTGISFIRSANTIDKLAINLELLGKNAQLTGQGLINNDIANITGNLDWQAQFKAFFNVNADHLSLSHPPHISGVVAPNITIELTKQLLTLTGEIEVKQGSVTITKLPEGSVSLSNDVIIVNDNGEEINQTSRFAIATDLQLNIADNINISGYGFNGVLGGKLLVKQQPHQDVQLFGNLNIVDGLYRAYGQRLAINKGRVSFNGPVDNPLIDLRTQRYIAKENVTAGIEIYGPANNLSVNLFSTPTKSKSEILSYIVRGRGVDTKAKSNDSLGIALGATLANASGVLEQIEKLPFINNLEVDGDDQQASIAGYVGDNIYLKYGFGVAEPINELTVRFYLLNRLWLEAVSGLEQSADLYFSFDVD